MWYYLFLEILGIIYNKNLCLRNSEDSSQSNKSSKKIYCSYSYKNK